MLSPGKHRARGKIPGLDYRSITGAGLAPSSGVEIVEHCRQGIAAGSRLAPGHDRHRRPMAELTGLWSPTPAGFITGRATEQGAADDAPIRRQQPALQFG
jgi:hypothetical protein